MIRKGHSKILDVSHIYVFICHLSIIALNALFVFLGDSFLSGISTMIILFYVVGQSIRTGLLRSFGIKANYLKPIQKVFIDILISSVYTGISAIALTALYLISLGVPLILLTICISDLGAIILDYEEGGVRHKLEPSKFKGAFLSVFPIIACFAYGVAIMLFRFRWLVWPETIGSDLFTHVAIVREIVERGGFELLFLVGYSYRFHAVAGLTAMTSGVDPYTLIGYGPFVVYPVSLALIYLFCKAMTNNGAIAGLAVMVFPFVNEVGALLGPHYMYPSTYALIMVLLVLTAIRVLPQTRFTKITVLMTYCTTLLIYPYFILVTLPAILYFWSHWNTQNNPWSKRVSILFVLAILGSALFFLLYYAILPELGFPTTTIELGVLGLRILPSLSLVSYLFLKAYSTFQIALLAFGLLLLLITSTGRFNPLYHKLSDDRGVFLLTTLYLMVFFLPITASYRVEMFIRPFISLCIALGAISILNLVHNGLKRFKQIPKMSWRGARPTKVVIAASILVFSIYPTAMGMDFSIKNAVPRPHIDEYNAFEWLRDHVPDGGYILTDPATGLIMRAFIDINCSNYLKISGHRSDLGVFTPFGNTLFEFFNTTPWHETEAYEAIETYFGEVSYIVVSPRTSRWIWHRRNGQSAPYAEYVQELGFSDLSWAKFYGARYNLVKTFGRLRILTMNDVIQYFFDDFEDVDAWKVNLGGRPQTNGMYGYFENMAHDVNWYHLYTNVPSLSAQTGLAVEIKYRSNVTGPESRVYGYTADDRAGAIVFHTKYIYPQTHWLVSTFRIQSSEFYQEGPLQSISLGFYCASRNWAFYIDYIRVYGTEQINYLEDVTYFEDPFNNVTNWHVNAGELPQSDGEIGYYENSAHNLNWYHMYTNVPSLENQTNLFLKVKYRANTTGLEGRFWGYKNDNREGGHDERAFYTVYVYPTLNWVTNTYDLMRTPGYIAGRLECISFGFYCSTKNWSFYVDHVIIFGYEERDFILPDSQASYCELGSSLEKQCLGNVIQPREDIKIYEMSSNSHLLGIYAKSFIVDRWLILSVLQMPDYNVDLRFILTNPLI